MFLALFNGMIIGTSRTINGQLSSRVGPFKASLWNHAIGFLFLTLVLLAMEKWQFGDNPAPPFSAYLGGFFGALFVAVNSYIFPRLGAMNATILVIGGQMISAVLMDWHNHHAAPGTLRCLGVAVLLLGMYLSKVSNASKEKDKKHD
jgi:transporter family-2 protein